MHLTQLPPAATDKRLSQPAGEGGNAARDAAVWLAAIVENSDDAILSKTLNGIITSWNPGASHLFGFTAEEAIGRPITIIIPDERLAEETRIIRKIRRGERIRHFETVRRRKDGSLVDISITVSPARDRAGRIIGASKIARDITETRKAAERQMLLLREMNHRIKNLFALTTGLIALSARGASSVEQLAADLSERISSLARAHHLTLPELADDPAANTTTLKALLEALLAPYDEITAPRVEIHGCDVPIGSRALTSLALLFHELATNAAKYGGLSSEGGKLVITITIKDDSLALCWRETTRTGINASPAREGFGSHLERASIRGLQGTILREWRIEGLAIQIRIPLALLEN